MNRLLAMAVGFLAGGMLVFFLFRPAHNPVAERAVTPDQACTVQQVLDGDSLLCRENNQQVRLLLIDSPEREQTPYHASAREFVEALMPAGTALRLESDAEFKDSFGRRLAYAWLPDGRMVNEEIVRAGFALAFPYKGLNVRYLERIVAAEESARRESAGFWKNGEIRCTPQHFRHKKCKGFQ